MRLLLGHVRTRVVVPKAAEKRQRTNPLSREGAGFEVGG
jgi:hypothetical protein